jgi:hypothetical protein
MTSLAIRNRPQLLPYAIAAIAVVAAVGVFDAIFGSAFAQATAGQQIFTDLNAKTTDLFYNARTIILIVCAIAIILTMVAALSGRFPMQKAIVLAGAILVIAVASSIVTYFASPGTVNSGLVPTLTDTGTAGG